MDEGGQSPIKSRSKGDEPNHPTGQKGKETRDAGEDGVSDRAEDGWDSTERAYARDGDDAADSSGKKGRDREAVLAEDCVGVPEENWDPPLQEMGIFRGNVDTPALSGEGLLFSQGKGDLRSLHVEEVPQTLNAPVESYKLPARPAEEQENPLADKIPDFRVGGF